MIFAALALIVLAVVFGPSLWVRYVMWKYSTEISGMPGTGAELARHIIEQQGLDGVGVEMTDSGNHYDPNDRMVRLSESNYSGRSLTAVAVAAHEVGHAIQHGHGDRRLAARTQLAPLAERIARIGVGAIGLAPIVGILTRHPVPISLLVVLGVSGLVARLLMHMTTLPIEWDASFGKALPILTKGQYIAPGEDVAVRRVLRAAAMTYVATALADVLNFARWVAILMRR